MLKPSFGYVVILITGLLCAIIFGFLIDAGSFRYSHFYRAEAVCSQVKPGFSLGETKRVISSFGVPPMLTYLPDGIRIQGTEAQCNIQLDSSGIVVTKVSISGLPVERVQ